MNLKRLWGCTLLLSGIVACDLIAPGYLRWQNPVFVVRDGVAKVRHLHASRVFKLQTSAILSDDPRLNSCALIYENTQALTMAQENARAALLGKSETVVLADLGAPACKLADGLYRWVSESGLALDVQFAATAAQEMPYREVQHVTLNR